MFQSITFYIGGKTLGIYGEAFPLGALTTEILNITPEEYRALDGSLKSAIEGMALYEKTHKLTDWHRVNEQMLRLNEALCRHRIFRLIQTDCGKDSRQCKVPLKRKWYFGVGMRLRSARKANDRPATLRIPKSRSNKGRQQKGKVCNFPVEKQPDNKGAETKIKNEQKRQNFLGKKAKKRLVIEPNFQSNGISFLRRGSQVVRQGSAKASSSVRFRPTPVLTQCFSGRNASLKKMGQPQREWISMKDAA